MVRDPHKYDVRWSVKPCVFKRMFDKCNIKYNWFYKIIFNIIELKIK